MASEHETTPQAAAGGDWVEQFRAQTAATYPHVHLWIYRYGADGGESGHVIIESIKVDKDARGMGLARTVLTALCEQADRHGDILSVTPNPVREGEWSAAPKRWARFFRTELGFVTKNRRAEFTIRETHVRMPREVSPK